MGDIHLKSTTRHIAVREKCDSFVKLLLSEVETTSVRNDLSGLQVFGLLVVCLLQGDIPRLTRPGTRSSSKVSGPAGIRAWRAKRLEYLSSY